MFKLTALILTLTAATLIYFTSKHQRFFSQPKPKWQAWIGGVFFILALLSWLQVFTITASIFIWLFTSVTALICIPLSTLLIDKEAL